MAKVIDYKGAGVDIAAGASAVERIKPLVAQTYSPAVLSGVGGFGSLYDLKPILEQYQHPVLVQSLDGVGTKAIVARMMDRYDTLGFDLVSACCNDIIVLGAQPLTFLDYIANDRLNPDTVVEIVRGIAAACQDCGVSLVGGEMAEMPDTYLTGEQDIVGVVTGLVEKDKIITGENITVGDVVLGLPSSGLHTNGYSLARKLFFEVGKFKVTDTHPDLNTTIGETLLTPHINYTKAIRRLVEGGISIHGMAHITGGGLIENIPRILPKNCAVELNTGCWPVPPVFKALQNLGKVEEGEMYRVFNMGIGMVLILKPEAVTPAKRILKHFTKTHVIGMVVRGTGVIIRK